MGGVDVVRTGLVISRGPYAVVKGGRSVYGQVERLLSRTRNVCVSVIPQPKAGNISAAFITLRVKSRELSPALKDEEVFVLNRSTERMGIDFGCRTTMAEAVQTQQYHGVQLRTFQTS